jgi:hypothetical protein
MNYTICDNKNSKHITLGYYIGYVTTLHQRLVSFSTERHEAVVWWTGMDEEEGHALFQNNLVFIHAEKKTQLFMNFK